MASLSLAAPRITRGDQARTHVEIPAGTTFDEPIVVEYQLDDGEAPSTLVVAGEGARATIIERIVGGVAGASVQVSSEIVAAAGADVGYAAVQRANAGVTLSIARRSTAAANARVAWFLADLGPAETRDELLVTLAAPGASAEVAAVFFPISSESLALRTEVVHAAADTTSTTVVRSIAAGRGRGRYEGNIRILPGTHGADASLRDDTLLFGAQARVDAIPALEIGSNDVRAFHGATVGEIDDEHIFYVMSRGIDRNTAEKLIALGFFEPAIARFPGEALRDELRAQLEAKLAEARR